MQELFLGCFGATPLTAGHIEVNGKKVALMSPRDAVRANIGLSLVPEDRKTEGLFLKLDGLKNISLPVLGRFIRFGLIDEERGGGVSSRSHADRASRQAGSIHPRWAPSAAVTNRRSRSANGYDRAVA